MIIFINFNIIIIIERTETSHNSRIISELWVITLEGLTVQKNSKLAFPLYTWERLADCVVLTT